MYLRYLLMLFVLGNCFTACSSSVQEKKPEKESKTEKSALQHAGFRYSSYGPEYNPGSNYWLSVGKRMAANFENTIPQCIWIVGVLSGEGTYLNFPVETDSKLIKFSSTDKNEATFDLFDKNGVEVWLQIEPGNAPVEETIHLMLKRYAHHKCVIGVGVDVEWYKSTDKADGKVVSDAEANTWLAIAKSYNKDYRLFLKHWLIEKMPPTARTDIVFVDDSQELGSLTNMAAEFKAWSNAFYPAQVSFQVGYDLDKVWWGKYHNPSQTIGNALVGSMNNMEALFWVDFTVLEIFPDK